MNFEIQYAALGAVRSRMQGTGGNLADCAKRLRRQMDVLNGQSGFGVETIRSRIGSSASSVSTQSGNAYVTSAFLSDLERAVTDQENKAYSALASTVPTEKRLNDILVSWTPENTQSPWWEKLASIFPELLPFVTAIGSFADWVSELFRDNHTNESGATSAKSRNYDGWGERPGTIRAVEYALLSQFCNTAAEKGNKNDMISSMTNSLKTLPEDHPLYGIDRSRIKAIREGSVEGIIIEVDADNAIVLFAGTDDIGDGFTDARIALDGLPVVNVASAAANLSNPISLLTEDQFEKAARIVNELPYDNVKVAGHSLGGHLAAHATLHDAHNKIAECMTFDAPGRGDMWWHNTVNKSSVDKITNYIAEGSLINTPGDPAGQSISLRVTANGEYLLYNHGIKEMFDALGGTKAISRP